MVRDEAAAGTARPGKFQQPDDMKTVQETILELARSRTVLAAALAEVGPVSGKNAGNWPSDAAVVSLQGRVKLAPPKGAEFGKTEVFYLNVEAESRPRAVALASAICKQLQIRSQDLRDVKAQSLIAELAKTADLAKADLGATTDELTQIESKVGADLGELRVLTETSGGESPLRHSISDMERELRDAEQSVESNQELLTVLKASKEDTGTLRAAPNRLLESQPVLRRLKDGLVDAQLRTAQLAGNMTDDHPSVIASKNSEQAIADHVREEIDIAIRGVQMELRLAQDRVATLQAQLADGNHRLNNLAEIRAQYGNLVNERNQRSDILKSAEQQLAEARASEASARTASLITVIDAPVAGDAPVGPGKATIVLGGAFGGFILGLGILFLTVPGVSTGTATGNAAGVEEVRPADPFGVSPTFELPRVFNGASATPVASAANCTNGHANGRCVFGEKLTVKQALVRLATAR